MRWKYIYIHTFCGNEKKKKKEKDIYIYISFINFLEKSFSSMIFSNRISVRITKISYANAAKGEEHFRYKLIKITLLRSPSTRGSDISIYDFSTTHGKLSNLVESSLRVEFIPVIGKFKALIKERIETFPRSISLERVVTRACR